jgi:hypothetical protein
MNSAKPKQEIGLGEGAKRKQREETMRQPIRFLSSMLLAGALVLPVAMQARDDHDHDHDKDRDHRYYDRDHHDYHNWDAREDQRYRTWYGDRYNGRDYRDYNRLNRRDQSAYWNWRHSRPDNDHDRDDRH